VSFSGLGFPFKNKPHTVTFLNLCWRLSFASSKHDFRITSTCYSGCLRSKPVKTEDPIFRASSPTPCVPENNKGFTQWNKPLKNDPIPCPLCTLDTRLVYSTYINTTAQIDVISCGFVEYSVIKPIPGLGRRITKIYYPYALGFSITSINGYCNWSGIIQSEV